MAYPIEIWVLEIIIGIHYYNILNQYATIHSDYPYHYYINNHPNLMFIKHYANY